MWEQSPLSLPHHENDFPLVPTLRHTMRTLLRLSPEILSNCSHGQSFAIRAEVRKTHHLVLLLRETHHLVLLLRAVRLLSHSEIALGPWKMMPDLHKLTTLWSGAAARKWASFVTQATLCSV